MSEASFFSFLATYAVPEDRANPIPTMSERWAASAEAFRALSPYAPGPLLPWDAAWGDPEALLARPGMAALLRHQEGVRFGGAPVEKLLVHHPSIDLEQADHWAARLADPASIAAPVRNDAPAEWRFGDQAQTLTIRAGYALLGAYFTADPVEGETLPDVHLQWQAGINVVQVGLLGDRPILINGHHRAYALARSGARVVPCVHYPIDDLGVVGASAGDSIDTALRSPAPPQLEHFLDPVLAVLVQLRRSTREVTLSIREETIQER